MDPQYFAITVDQPDNDVISRRLVVAETVAEAEKYAEVDGIEIQRIGHELKREPRMVTILHPTTMARRMRELMLEVDGEINVHAAGVLNLIEQQLDFHDSEAYHALAEDYEQRRLFFERMHRIDPLFVALHVDNRSLYNEVHVNASDAAMPVSAEMIQALLDNDIKFRYVFPENDGDDEVFWIDLECVAPIEMFISIPYDTDQLYRPFRLYIAKQAGSDQDIITAGTTSGVSDAIERILNARKRTSDLYSLFK